MSSIDSKQMDSQHKTWKENVFSTGYDAFGFDSNLEMDHQPNNAMAKHFMPKMDMCKFDDKIQPIGSTKWSNSLIFIIFHVNRRLQSHHYIWNQINSFGIIGYVKRRKKVMQCHMVYF